MQLIQQVKHAIETGALQSGDRLPTIRKIAEDLIINPNTVARAYRELEHAAVIEVRHGTGAFVAEMLPPLNKNFRKAGTIVQQAVERLVSLGISDDEIRRLIENELALACASRQKEIPND